MARGLNLHTYLFVYPKRSKAAYPPPRCVLDHKLNGSKFEEAGWTANSSNKSSKNLQNDHSQTLGGVNSMGQAMLASGNEWNSAGHQHTGDPRGSPVCRRIPRMLVRSILH